MTKNIVLRLQFPKSNLSYDPMGLILLDVLDYSLKHLKYATSSTTESNVSWKI